MENRLTLENYQRIASRSDKTVNSSNSEDVIVPLLGISGECGSLHSEYKKFLRDGSSFSQFKNEAAEELGDILWYTSTLASRLGLSLEDVASQNLKKCDSRWVDNSQNYDLYDNNSITNEQLPRSFVVDFRANNDGGLSIFHNGNQIGDPLTDNSYREDGYRFHDVFHLAYSAILGWSPVCRKLFECKRKSESCSERNVDEVEDGGRAAVIEEGISALVFSYASRHDFFVGTQYISYSLLRTIKDMTSHLEVSTRSFSDWERAILQGFNVWHQLNVNSGGLIEGNLLDRTILYTYDL